jgi:undecaprenyl-diphosphatase
MEMITAIALGVIQGLTEFLPISSSAHLILVPWLFGWDPEGLIFDVSLHVGTAIAILAYFWRDWILLAREVLRGIVQRDPFGNPHRRLGWFLVVGTLPAMGVGLAFEKYVETNFRSPLISVFTLVAFALVLYCADRSGRQARSLTDISLADSLWIGVGQALALIPGVSRSGITISVGLFRDLDRTAAARFSFLLSTPVIVGAGLLQAWHLVKAARHPSLAAAAGVLSGSGEIKWTILACGISSSVIVGFLCIRYFLRYIQKHSFLPFVIYRILLALAVLAVYLRHGI